MADHKAGESNVTLDVAEGHKGVTTVEATHRVFGKYSKWALFISLGLAAYIYSLDGSTTYLYLPWATSELGMHSLLASVSVAQAVIVAVGKPVVAKLADTTSRGFAYIFVLFAYVIGYIIIASAKSVQAIAGGKVFYSTGYTGLQILTQIIIADITVLKWRGFVSAMISAPFIINAFVGALVSADVIAGAGWRWGYGMFAILVPATILPLIITLLWAERKAKRLGLVPVPEQTSFVTKVKRFISELDVFGLLLLGTAVALILLPITLSRTAKGGWNNPSIIAMIVIGFGILPFFVIWESKFAKFPVVPRRFLGNLSVMGASMIGFFDFVSFYLCNTYLYSFIIVVKPWSLKNAGYFSQTQLVALTVFGILGGTLLRVTHRYKPILIFGLAVRFLGVGIMIHARGANGTDAAVIIAQVLQGFGGGFAAVTSQVAAQASVPHIDVATATAIVLLITEIGGAIGTAIAGAIWINQMPAALTKHLPGVPEANVKLLFGSITAVVQYPRGHPIREGVIDAYTEVMHTLLIVAIVTAAIPFVISLFMPNWYLGDEQNAVTKTDLAGEKVEGSGSDHGDVVPSTHSDEKREAV